MLPVLFVVSALGGGRVAFEHFALSCPVLASCRESAWPGGVPSTVVGIVGDSRFHDFVRKATHIETWIDANMESSGA